MGRPPLKIWKEFVTTAPADANKRQPDVACVHCRTLVRNARPANLMRHALRCTEMSDEVRLRLGETSTPKAPTVTRLELEAAMAQPQPQSQPRPQMQDQIKSRTLSEEEEEEDEQEHEMEQDVTPVESRPVLGKRPRTPSDDEETVEQLLSSIRYVLTKNQELKKQELQLRRMELEFQREALATKMEDRRKAREEERRDRREQQEAARQERVELARIENEKNLAFLKAVMESSAHQRQ